MIFHIDTRLENKTVKICNKLDVCSKINILKDHDWACDSQFTDSIREICVKCEEFES
jgi:hypothetical protein